MSETNHTEEWRPVVGWESLYSVSSIGRVRRSTDGRCRKKGALLSNGYHPDGYPLVSLYRNGQGRTKLVHGLVAEAFLGKRPKNHQVNHKDGNKANNRVANLEWVTPKQNSRHAIEQLGVQLGVLGERNPSAKLNEKKVCSMRAIYARGNITQAALAKIFRVSYVTAHEVVRGKNWKSVSCGILEGT